MAIFEQTTFLGASITDASCKIGFNGDQAQLNVNVVVDPKNEDDFDPVPTGHPATFELGRFRFRGLLQSAVRRNDFGANPAYTVNIVDCRDILDGCQLIMNSYSGFVGPLKNLLNIYGYAELRYGFGGSLVNDSGMPWFLVKEGIEYIMEHNIPEMGGRFSFRGIEYTIDLSEMPIPPPYYRVGGGSFISLLDVISQVCLDGGHDFFLELSEDNVITVKTVSRVLQPPMTLVQQFLDEHTDVVIGKQLGKELRHEVTSAFLIGGQVESIHQTDEIVPFWGFDNQNHPIIGQGTGEQHTFTVLADEIEDVLGGTTYQCTVEELTYALVDQNSWQTFIKIKRPTLATGIGMDVRINTDAVAKILGRNQVVNKNKEEIKKITGYLFSNAQVNVKRLYDFVRKIATDFYGRKFVARIPFILSKTEPESLKIVYSQQPTSSGWVTSGTALNLNQALAPIFTDQQGKLECFVRFRDVRGADITSINVGDDSVIQDNTLFMKATVDPGVYYVNNIPCAILTLVQPVWNAPVTPHGDISAIATLLNWPVEQLLKMYGKGKAGGVFTLAKHPLALLPDAAAVPLKSNTTSYGPWYYAGVPGKVMAEKDDSLVPWEYGRVDILNAAADAKIKSATTSQTEAETGDLSLAGAPILTIGEALIEGGPIVTNLRIDYAEKGVFTGYGLQTYTSRWGLFEKGTIERLRRFAFAINQNKNRLRQALSKALQRQHSQRTRRDFFDYTRLVETNPRSPHNIIQAFVDTDGIYPVPSISFVTQDEARASCNANDDQVYSKQNAFMDLGGLFRPFTTDSNSGQMPNFKYEYDAAFPINISSINPFKRGNDIQVFSYGSEFEEWWTYDTSLDPDTKKIRGIGMRMPMMGVGWGYGIDHESPTGLIGTDYLKNNKKWKAGPIDHVWDKYRECWTSHDIIPGTSVGEIAAGAEGTMKILNSDPPIEIKVTNKFSMKVKANKFMMAAFTPYFNKLLVLSFDC